MARYKIGFIPKHLPYQLTDVYTVELAWKPVGGLSFGNVIYESENIQDCMAKMKELKIKNKKNKGNDANGI